VSGDALKDVAFDGLSLEFVPLRVQMALAKRSLTMRRCEGRTEAHRPPPWDCLGGDSWHENNRDGDGRGSSCASESEVGVATTYTQPCGSHGLHSTSPTLILSNASLNVKHRRF